MAKGYVSVRVADLYLVILIFTLYGIISSTPRGARSENKDDAFDVRRPNEPSLVPPAMFHAPVAINRNSTMITIRWARWEKPPDGGDGPVYSYLIYYKALRNFQWKSMRSEHEPGTNQQYLTEMIHDLEENTPYQVKVTPVHYADYKGYPSPVLNTSTCGVPQAGPAEVFAHVLKVRGLGDVDSTMETVAGDNDFSLKDMENEEYVIVEWENPEARDWNCEAISSYKVYIRNMDQEGEFQQVAQVPDNQQQFSISDVDVNSPYQVGVSLVNSAGLESKMTVAPSIDRVGESRLQADEESGSGDGFGSASFSIGAQKSQSPHVTSPLTAKGSPLPITQGTYFPVSEQESISPSASKVSLIAGAVTGVVAIGIACVTVFFIGRWSADRMGTSGDRTDADLVIVNKHTNTYESVDTHQGPAAQSTGNDTSTPENVHVQEMIVWKDKECGTDADLGISTRHTNPYVFVKLSRGQVEYGTEADTSPPEDVPVHDITMSKDSTCGKNDATVTTHSNLNDCVDRPPQTDAGSTGSNTSSQKHVLVNESTVAKDKGNENPKEVPLDNTNESECAVMDTRV